MCALTVSPTLQRGPRHADPRAPRMVQLLVADPGFAEGIPAADRAVATRSLALPAFQLGAGPWSERATRLLAHERLLLIVSGLVAREVALNGRLVTQLLGPGDIVFAGPDEADALGCAAHLHVDQTAGLAVLGERFRAGTRVWPSLSQRLEERLIAQLWRASREAAILVLPHIEDRVRATLWHLAETWGRVRVDGVLLPLPLTHRRIGRMSGAQRSTVTLALRELAERGEARRVPEGWLLRRTEDVA